MPVRASAIFCRNTCTRILGNEKRWISAHIRLRLRKVPVYTQLHTPLPHDQHVPSQCARTLVHQMAPIQLQLIAHQVPMVLAGTPARHCVCGHFFLRMLAAYGCRSICTCIALLGSPHNAVHLSSFIVLMYMHTCRYVLMHTVVTCLLAGIYS